MRRNSHPFKHIDWILVLLYALLVLMGWINIYAATYNEEHSSILDFSQSYGKQLMWILVCLVLIGIVLLLEGHIFKQLSGVIYGLCSLLLLAVLLIGTEIKGNKSWIVLGSFSLQPAEFAKYGTSLLLSAFLSNLPGKFLDARSRIIALGLMAIPALLVLAQPDVGSVLVFAAFIFVLYREGMSGNVLLAGLFFTVLFILSLLLNHIEMHLPFGIDVNGNVVLVSVLALISAFFFYIFKRYKRALWLIPLVFSVSIITIFGVEYVFDNVMKPHHQSRINNLLGLENDIKGAGYNVNQSLIAIGSGGFAGKGFLQGTQTKYDFVPEQSTDFIFCTIGEEWGFLGTLTVIFLFMALLFRLVIAAERQRSRFSRIYGYCVASIIFFHFTVNVGMTIGLAPVIGIPLPFFSYGGSSLMAFTLLLFTFIKLDSERMHVLR
jgi:rod shape determining protein RodA